jgi:hypothetical protein
MSAQTLGTNELPDGQAEFGGTQPDTAPRALRILAVVAVCLGVIVLAAATFVLSYSAIRAVALQAGITPRLARGYPLLLDAMLVIVLAAVLALRSAGLPSRLLAWLTLFVVMAAAAGAEALHAAGRALPHQAAAITAAVLPWVLVLVAFALLLVMLRHARLRRVTGPDDRVVAHSAWPQGAAAQRHAAQATVPSHVIVQPARSMPLQLGPATVTARHDVVGESAPAHAQPELAMDADPAADDPSTDEAANEPADGTTPYPAESLAPGGYDEAANTEAGDTNAESEEASPAPAAEAAEPDDPDLPMFHRLFSSPTPPTDV